MRGAWIEHGSALDLHFAGDVPPGEGWEGVDLLPITPGPRLRSLLVADMDSTMIGQECIDELADYAGVKPQVSEITERAMQGELDFAGALRARVALLEGLDEAVLARCLAERVRPNPGAKTLIATMRQHGATCLLVSGGFTAFAGPVGAMLGFDEVRANTLTIRNGRLSGTVDGTIVDSTTKRASLEEARARLGLASDATMALGDGANDRAMVEAAVGALPTMPSPRSPRSPTRGSITTVSTRCCGRRVFQVPSGCSTSAVRYFAATTKQACPRAASEEHAALASARLANGPAWSRVIAPTGTR